MATIGEILKKAALAQYNWSNMEKELYGYETFTTFYSDFTIADLCGGVRAIKSTYNTSLKSFKQDIKYMTELALVLNHKCWEHYEKQNIELSKLYSDLYYKIRDYILDHFKGEDISYFLNIID